MKKILSVFVTFFVLFSCICLNVSAKTVTFSDVTSENPFVGNGEEITLSEDLTELYCGDSKYIRFDGSSVRVDIYEDVENKVVLSEKQASVIKRVLLSSSETKSIVWAEIKYFGGANLSVAFLLSEYIDEYNEAVSDNWKSATVSIGWDEKKEVTVSQEKLFSQKIYRDIGYENIDEFLDVEIAVGNNDFTVKKGEILWMEAEEVFYYYDYNEYSVSAEDGFDPTNTSQIGLYKITDKELIAELNGILDYYYDSDLGFMENDSFMKSVSDIFTILLFAIIPFGLAVLFFALSFKAKGIYKKFFITISAVSLTEVAIFLMVVAYLFLKK